MNSVGEAVGLASQETTRNGNHARAAIAGSSHSAAPPLFRSRPESYCEKTATVTVNASRDVYRRLSQITKDDPFLRYAALAAAVTICLFRYTRNARIAIGSPAMRQENAKTDNDSVIALVSDVHGGMTFNQFLHSVEQNLSDVSDKTYDVSSLFAEASQEQTSRCPLFDVALAVSGLHYDLPEVRNDVTVTYCTSMGKVWLEATFSPELYDRPTIERFCGHILRVLQSGLQNTNASLSDLAILTDQEREELVVEFNRTAIPYPRNKCVHELFEEHVAIAPGKTALVCGNQRLTYRELNERANQVAHYLNRLGATADTPIGVFLGRSLEQVIAVLGILKSGAAYVPYDPSYPRERLAAMFEDLQPKTVLTCQRLTGQIPADVERICMDTEADVLARESTEKLPVHPEIHHLCYIIFTSGSTGRSKAVAVPHGGWTNLLNWFVNEFNITSADKNLVMSSISFDITQRAMAMPLVKGAELHLIASDHYEPELILKTLQKEAITLMNCAPSTFYPLVESGNISLRYEQLSSLRCLFLGGEAISASRLKNWATRPECKVRIGNVYGAAECSDVSSFYVLHDFDRYIDTSVPIGKAIYNTQIYILDDNLQLVPRGVAGEICLAGDGVGRGYINDASLTAKKFPKNPFSSEEGNLLYRTGDVSRYLPDGNLEFVGRVDNQVKIRGQRVELGEIETVLRQHPNVREAVAMQSNFTSDNELLVAYVVPREPVEEDSQGNFIDELRTALSSKLPRHMVPNAFVILDELPLNPNGKIDRSALPAPELVQEGRVLEPPTTEVEKLIAEVFSRVLKVVQVDQISLKDNFFNNLGGHSLQVPAVLEGLDEVFKTYYPALEFFKDPTVAGIARRLEEEKSGAQSD